MSALASILSVLATGFLIGGAARWAVPGPDPMPFWLTVLIGLGGSLVGGGIAAAIFGASHLLDSGGHVFGTVILEIGAAAALVVGYRRLVQNRPITGPDAYRFPTRGVGVARLRERLQQLGIDPDQMSSSIRRRRSGGSDRAARDAAEFAARLRELQEKRARGEISEEEFQRELDELQRR